MMYLCTAFNKNLPIVSCLFGDDVEMVPLYGGSLSLKNIDANKKKICDVTKNERVVALDCKAHYDVFDLSPSEMWEASPTTHVNGNGLSLLDAKKALLKCVKVMTKMDDPPLWRKIVADAAKTYSKLQTKVVIADGKIVHPIYYLDTFSGRSRAAGFPIHTIGGDVAVATDYDYFIHFDWLSADIRIASILSEDEDLMSSFNDSDPYTYLSNALDLPRSDCKTNLLAAIYSLSVDEPILQCFPKFRQWMIDSIEKMEADGYADSILGRRFYLSEKASDRTVFNAVIQGSVAHAMCLVLAKVFNSRPNNVFTELQDALVMITRKDDVGELIEEVVDVMLHPFEGILEENPVFPVRVSIGKKWRKWKKYREFR